MLGKQPFGGLSGSLGETMLPFKGVQKSSQIFLASVLGIGICDSSVFVSRFAINSTIRVSEGNGSN